MARAPIKEQGRFGPAQSRARVFSAFVQPRQPDLDTAESLAKASDALGSAGEYVAQRDAERADEERRQGLEDFVAGRIRDGQRIVEGELQPIESEFYMAGVEMGRGRQRGRRAQEAFAQWSQENQRPGLDAPEGAYQEWLERGLAESQAAAGLDPDTMTDLELSEYASRIDQVRDNDSRQQTQFLNDQARAQTQEVFMSDMMELSPENFWQGFNELFARGTADGLDRSRMRRMASIQAANLAIAHRDPSLLELPDGLTHLQDAQSIQQRRELTRAVELQLDRERLENEDQIFVSAYRNILSGDFDAAERIINEAFPENEEDQTIGVSAFIRLASAAQNGREAQRREHESRVEGMQILQAGELLRAGNFDEAEAFARQNFTDPSRLNSFLNTLERSRSSGNTDEYGLHRLTLENMYDNGQVAEARAYIDQLQLEAQTDAERGHAATLLSQHRAEEGRVEREQSRIAAANFEQAQRVSAVARAVESIRSGGWDGIEEVSGTNPHDGTSFSISESDLREEAIQAFRAETLGQNWRNLEGEAAHEYRTYFRTLSENGLRDPDAQRLLDSAIPFTDPESATQDPTGSRVMRAYRLYQNMDIETRRNYVDNDRLLAVFDHLDAAFQLDAAMEPTEAVSQAVTAAHGQLEGPRQMPSDRLDRLVRQTRIEDPLHEGSWWNPFSNPETAVEDGEVVAFQRTRVMHYLNMNWPEDRALERAEEDVQSAFTIFNGQPVRVPGSTSDRVTEPEQWATTLDYFTRGLAAEDGSESSEGYRVSHSTGNVYLLTKPDGSIMRLTANQIRRGAGAWLADNDEAAAEREERRQRFERRRQRREARRNMLANSSSLSILD